MTTEGSTIPSSARSDYIDTNLDPADESTANGSLMGQFLCLLPRVFCFAVFPLASLALWLCYMGVCSVDSFKIASVYLTGD